MSNSKIKLKDSTLKMCVTAVEDDHVKRLDKAHFLARRDALRIVADCLRISVYELKQRIRWDERVK